MSHGRVLPLGALLAAAMVWLGGLHGAATAQAFSKAIWGPVTRAGVDQFPLYHKLGASIYEADLNWATVAARRPARPTDPADPAYAWPTELDRAIAGARAQHIRVLLQIITSPAWENGGHSPAWVPARAADYAAFAAAATRRYPQVHLWMIWGEPTKPANFAPLPQYPPAARLSASGRRYPHLYAQMLDGAYAALKKADRANLVIGGCTYTTGGIDAINWIKNLRLPNGRAPRMDMYAHNPFTYEDPTFTHPVSPFNEIQFSDLPRLVKYVDRYLRRGMPVFLSEFTIPTAPDNEFNFYVDPPVAAKWLQHALSESRHWNRIYALGWVHLYDDPPLSAGGLLNADGVPKPTFAAFQAG